MRVVISAGPTREMIDAVRFLSNRSTGKMGYALAQAAVAAGHETVLVSGPVSLKSPPGVELIPVTSAAEMAAAMKQEMAKADVVIMAAAVADYRPKSPITGKLKKGDGDLTVVFERTEDVLQTLGKQKRPGQLLIGFAAEYDNVEHNALEKLARKNLDWIAANDISRPGCGFEADTNTVVLYNRQGRRIELKPGAKADVAVEMLNVILEDFHAQK